jgi:hypothetical protein
VWRSVLIWPKRSVLLLLILAVTGSNPGANTDYPDWRFRWFSFIPPSKCLECTSNFTRTTHPLEYPSPSWLPNNLIITWRCQTELPKPSSTKQRIHKMYTRSIFWIATQQLRFWEVLNVSNCRLKESKFMMWGVLCDLKKMQFGYVPPPPPQTHTYTN